MKIKVGDWVSFKRGGVVVWYIGIGEVVEVKEDSVLVDVDGKLVSVLVHEIDELRRKKRR